MFGQHVGVLTQKSCKLDQSNENNCGLKTNGERTSVTSASNFDGKLKCQGICDLIRLTLV